MAERTYFCTCTARCRRAGQSGKHLKYSTYKAHEVFRNADARGRHGSHESGSAGQTIPLEASQAVAAGPVAAVGSASPNSTVGADGMPVDAQAVMYSELENDAPMFSEEEPEVLPDAELPVLHLPQGEGAMALGEDQTADVGSSSLQLLEDEVLPVLPAVDDELDESRIEDLEQVRLFINALKRADIHNGDLSESAVARLTSPPTGRVVLDETQDRDLLLSLRLYLAHLNSPEAAYTASARACMRAHPGDTLMSLYLVKQWIENTTGVSPIVHDMCPNSCLAYTGHLASLTACSTCGMSRYLPGSKRPRQRFTTIPLAPILQAMCRDPTASQQLDYGARRLAELRREADANGGRIQVIDDVLCGSDVLDAYRSNRITDSDILLMISCDGCQIYRDKQSDCWIYIWILLSLAPDQRYKLRAIQPGGFIPGPRKPANFESFIFPGLHHIAAVNRLPGGGLPLWRAHTNTISTHRLFIVAAGADGPAMTNMNGLVGHSGRLGCRFFCHLKGRRKPGQGGHHYPCLLKPDGDYTVEGSDHSDYAVTELPSAYSGDYTQLLRHVMESPNNTEYGRRRAATAISRPSILTGLGRDILGVPRMCGGDIMHLVLNLGELFIPLWRGTFERASTDKEPWYWETLVGRTWEQHGADVAAATSCLPSSFGRAPRNPAEKINSGYKQWEWLIYLFCLCPGLLYKVLPEQIWKSFCKLARGIRMLYQYSGSPESSAFVGVLFQEFQVEFELMYYERRADRIHFVRQSIHVLSHYAPEIVRVGPGLCSSQFTMERTIGNLTQELRLHSAPYANLSQRGFLRCAVNALCAMIPGVLITPPTSSSSIDIGGGYVLLPKMDRSPHTLVGAELDAFREHVPNSTVPKPRVVRWGRLRLPNGQIARSLFKEAAITRQNLRNTRNVKLNIGGRTCFAEVRFYFQYLLSGTVHNLCMAMLYSDPDEALYRESSGAVYSCTLTADVVIVDIRAVQSVVAMVPHSLTLLTAANLGEQFKGRVFVVEQPGLEVLALAEPESDGDDASLE